MTFDLSAYNTVFWRLSPLLINAWKSVKKERMLFLITQTSHTMSHTQINKKAPCNKGRYKRIFFDFI